MGEAGLGRRFTYVQVGWYSLVIAPVMYMVKQGVVDKLEKYVGRTLNGGRAELMGHDVWIVKLDR
ncbi:hypothetical protein M3647_05920 [Paenibacillus cellulositrophicus]|nr:hypothetical protein [Paenibacillus cellulositrophicus]MCM2997000.1 hypothetical protein [Paenibacillus cellulositrophicus]